MLTHLHRKYAVHHEIAMNDLNNIKIHTRERTIVIKDSSFLITTEHPFFHDPVSSYTKPADTSPPLPIC
jgi:hypothetical protein